MRIVPNRLRYISRQSDTRCKKPPVLLGRAENPMTYSTPALVVPAPVQRLRSPHLPENVARSAESTSWLFFRDQTGSAELRTSEKHAGSHVSVIARMVPPFPGRVAPFKNDDHHTTLYCLTPILKLTEFGLQPTELFFHIPFFLGAPLFPPLWLGDLRIRGFSKLAEFAAT